MAPIVIDLTSSPEPEDSPDKAARLALNNFQPRSQKADISKPKKDEQKRSPTPASPSTLEHFEPRNYQEPVNSNGKFATQSLLVGTPSAQFHGYGKRSEAVAGNGYVASRQPAHKVLQGSSAGYHAHPSNGPKLPVPSNGTENNAQPIRRSGAYDTSNQPLATLRAPPVPKITKAPVEVISIGDDSDATSTSSDSLPAIETILQAELNGLRPFKKRRINGPAEGFHSRGSEQRLAADKASRTAPHLSNGSGASLHANIPAANELPIRPTPPPVEGRQTTTQFVDDRSESEQLRAIRAQGLRIGLPFTAQEISNGSASGQLRSRSKLPSDSRFLTREPTRMRAEPDSNPGPGQVQAHQAEQAENTEHRPQPVSEDVTVNLSASGSRNQSHRLSTSTSSSHLSYKSAHSRTESGSQDQELKGPCRETQPHASAGVNTTSVHQPTLDSAAAKLRLPYTQVEDDLLIRLREHQKLDWKDILPYFPTRSIGSISGHYSELRARQQPKQHRSSGPANISASYSQAEDDLLIKLRDVDKLDWHRILPHFPGRAMGSISGHYGQLKAKASQQIPKQLKPFQHHSPNSNHGITYSAEEDALLVELKEVRNLNWDEIVPYFRGRTRGSLQVRYSSKLKSESKSQHRSPKPQLPVIEHHKSNTNHGIPYSAEEDALVVKLRSEGLSWDQMVAHFNGRTAGSLAVRYSSKLREKSTRNPTLDDGAAQQMSTDDDDSATRPRRRRRHNGPSVLSGFISWADIKKSRQNVFEDEESGAEEEQQVQQPVYMNSRKGTERAFPKSLSRILRQRQIGDNGGRSWSHSTRAIPDELKEYVFNDVGPQRYFQGTSGDVTSIAWAADGNRFAAGSIAITDERSMQYNKPCNLLLGDAHESFVHELPEHHIQRPINTDVRNVNSLHSMRETQDQRLFMTVSSVQFSPNGLTLYSAGMDGKARAYQIDNCNIGAACRYELEHPAAVYLLSVSNLDVLATACHQAADGCVRIYNGDTKFASLSPSRTDNQTDRPIYPSTLKWGTSWRHSNLLLAGFSIDSFDEERNLAGETCLWDVHHEKRIEINAVTRNVFDVAWNPSPSSGSTAFAVASTPGVNKVNRGTRTVVQCFAPRQNRAAAVLEFESRAFDINDLIYCAHDNNLIAAGATDGKVYIWDQRYAKRGNGPLHVLAHDQSLNVLDHDRERELADTGVRFLSWGATSSRLYSGSSDGIVKVWNPYRSSSEAHVKDIATFTSAVMSGAFSPDYRDLLIGEDQGRINLLSVGHECKSIRSMGRFELRQAHTSKDASIERPSGRTVARELLETGQIELRPMGALSKRQAVQGLNYKGPYLAPSGKELQEAEAEYQMALNLQNDEHSQAAVSPTQSSDVGQALLEADKRVQTAQEKLVQLQSRLDDSEALRPQAEANQRKLRIAEMERTELEASLSSAFDQCKLDCNYLPTNIDEDNEAIDSQRSESRIPAALWKRPEINTDEMNALELIDAGFTHRCATCHKPARTPKSGLPSCESCARKRLGITATCGICSSPMRPTLEAKTPNLCERCNFSCFRCGKPAFIAHDAAKISCYQCDLSWTAGVLGFELATTRKVSEPSDRRMKTLDVETVRDEEMTG